MLSPVSPQAEFLPGLFVVRPGMVRMVSVSCEDVAPVAPRVSPVDVNCWPLSPVSPVMAGTWSSSAHPLKKGVSHSERLDGVAIERLMMNGGRLYSVCFRRGMQSWHETGMLLPKTWTTQ